MREVIALIEAGAIPTRLLITVGRLLHRDDVLAWRDRRRRRGEWEDFLRDQLCLHAGDDAAGPWTGDGTSAVRSDRDDDIARATPRLGDRVRRAGVVEAGA